MTAATRKTLAFGRVGNTFVYVSSKKGSPAPEDWEEYLDFLTKNTKPGVLVNTLVVEQGDGPTAAQRKRLVDLTKPFVGRIAVVTRSAVGRGVVTALSWFRDTYRGFSPAEMDAALEHLQVTPTVLPDVKRLLATLEREVL